jgi:hypothetical protein
MAQKASDICPECQDAKKHITEDGKRWGYCKPCTNKRQNKKRREELKNLIKKIYCPW